MFTAESQKLMRFKVGYQIVIVRGYMGKIVMPIGQRFRISRERDGERYDLERWTGCKWVPAYTAIPRVQLHWTCRMANKKGIMGL